MQTWITLGVFLFVTVLTAIDIIVDYGKGGGAAHLVTEGTVMALGLIGLITLVGRIFVLRREAGQLRRHLENSRKEAHRWQQEHRQILQGLGSAIEEQFEHWQLTEAEKSVGLFLLKGFSLKEIADLRSTSERTVRQQAGQIYQKAQVGSRAEFSAFFLEDLLLPMPVEGKTK